MIALIDKLPYNRVSSPIPRLRIGGHCEEEEAEAEVEGLATTLAGLAMEGEGRTQRQAGRSEGGQRRSD